MNAQLWSSSGRSSKILKDRKSIETVVEVVGAGRLVLHVDGEGGYSLRAFPAMGSDTTSRNLLAVGVVRADGIVSLRPEESSDTEAGQQPQRPDQDPSV